VTIWHIKCSESSLPLNPQYPLYKGRLPPHLSHSHCKLLTSQDLGCFVLCSDQHLPISPAPPSIVLLLSPAWSSFLVLFILWYICMCARFVCLYARK
jgi:hypothetical protein